MPQPPDMYYLSEQALTLQFGTEPTEAVWARVQACHALLQHRPFAGFETSVPAYTTLSVFYNPVEAGRLPGPPGGGAFEKVAAYLRSLEEEEVGKTAVGVGTTVTLPVCYGGAYGPDMPEVLRLTGLGAEQVIALHSAAVYKVYIMGFVPGFAYLGGLDARLHTPRRREPRKAVPPGSVGLGGAQTGVYPLPVPGGWQLIGRTPLRLFDPALPQPALLQTGNRVQFRPISAREFEHLYHHPADADTPH